jgi:hypothetical protein
MTEQSKDVSKFFLILTFFFGLYVRLFPLFRTDFPLVDGGMFYTMIRDLQASHFSLPVFTTYNQAGIPFAYPPLAFYIAGLINTVTGISLTDIIKWQPVFVNILAIPLFYYFVKRVFDSEPKAALATLIFALTPNSYWWNIVGGGLTRSMGSLFFIITAISASQMYREKKTFWVVVSIFSGAFVVLSHLSWALQSATIFLLSWLLWGRNRQGIRNSIIVAAGVLLLTAPWWMAILQQHGMEAFFQAGQVTHSRWLFWTILFALSFTGEYTTVIAVFALIGFFLHLAKRNYYFPLWALLTLIVDPRGGIAASIFPFAVLAVSAITDGIAPQLFTAKTGDAYPDAWIQSLGTKAGRLFFGFFIILFLYNAYNVSNTLSYQVVGKPEFEAIQWVKLNTGMSDRFLILDEQNNPLLSPFTEWFPALTERRSIATIQGTEWLEGNRHYNKQYPIITSLHECLYTDVECLYSMAKDTEPYDFIILSSKIPVPLLNSLEECPDFVLTFSSPTIKIFKTNMGQPCE